MKKAFWLFLSVILLFSLNSVFAQEKVTLHSSSTDKGETGAVMEKPQKVSEMKTVVVTGKSSKALKKNHQKLRARQQSPENPAVKTTGNNAKPRTESAKKVYRIPYNKKKQEARAKVPKPIVPAKNSD